MTLFAFQAPMSPVLRTSAGTGGAPAVSADLWGLEGNGVAWLLWHGSSLCPFAIWVGQEEIYELDGKLRRWALHVS